MNKAILAASVALICLGASAARAQSAGSPATATFNVSLSVTAGCSVTATDIAFGPIRGSATTAPTTSGSSVAVTCTNTTPYTVTFTGAHDVDATTKKMVGSGSSSNTLLYNLVNDTTPATVYGSDVGHEISATGTGSAQTTTVDAILTDWSAFKAIDSYSDVETVTVAF